MNNKYISLLNYFISGVDPGQQSPLNNTIGKLPEYYITDINFLAEKIFKYGKTNFDLNMNIKNLFNVKWWNINPMGLGNYIYPGAFPQKGINFMVSIKANIPNS